MNKIDWKWDTEPEWDSFTLLGDIRIESDNGSYIIEECTIIDSWITPLFEGLTLLKENSSSEYDLINEPGLLKFEIQNEEKIIKYENQSVFLNDNDIDELIYQLKQLCIKILNYIQDKSEIFDKGSVEIFRDVIEKCR